MNVSEALASRFTCRAFLPTPVPEATVRDILAKAARTPSGGNLQPWRVWALTGEALARTQAAIFDKVGSGLLGDGYPEYLIYPPEMKEPYATRRFRNGEGMFEALGVAREDDAGRMANYASNFRLFGAPVGLVFAIDRDMHQGQWADIGMFMQSIMLLAREHGLHTAPLESWSLWHITLRKALEMPDELILFCAMALGHADLSAPVNRFRAERASVAEFTVFDGFGAPNP